MRLKLLIIFLLLFAPFLTLLTTKNTMAAGCVFSPNQAKTGDTIGIITNGMPGTLDVALVSYGAFLRIGVINNGPSTGIGGGSVKIPQDATLPAYQVRVFSGFGTPDDVNAYLTCSDPSGTVGGNLTITNATGGGGGGIGGGGQVECDSFINCIKNDVIKNPSNRSGTSFVGSLVSDILPLAIAFGGFLAIIMIVISGIQFVTSSGDANAAAGARSRLTFSLIGFALLVLAFMIAKLVDAVFLGNSGIFN